MSSERMERAEERIAWLERHVTEQDKVVLQLGDEVARLRKELVLLRERQVQAAPPLDPNERPPHY